MCLYCVVDQRHTDILFEDVEPAAILDVRTLPAQTPDGKEDKEYLVRWADDTDDSWVRDIC